MPTGVECILCTRGRKDRLDLVRQVDTQVPISSAAMHPTNHRLWVCGSAEDLWVHLVDGETGETLQVCKGHHGPVHCVDFSPDGQVYASGSEDGTVRLWQTIPGKPYGLWNPTTTATTTATVPTGPFLEAMAPTMDAY